MLPDKLSPSKTRVTIETWVTITDCHPGCVAPLGAHRGSDGAAVGSQNGKDKQSLLESLR